MSKLKIHSAAKFKDYLCSANVVFFSSKNAEITLLTLCTQRTTFSEIIPEAIWTL